MRRVAIVIMCALPCACEEPREEGPNPFGQSSTSDGMGDTDTEPTTGISMTSGPDGSSDSGEAATSPFTTGPTTESDSDPSTTSVLDDSSGGTGSGSTGEDTGSSGGSTGNGSSSEDTGIGECGRVEPGAGMCPAACDDCTDGVCTIVCSGDNACSGANFDCPNDWPCVITCEGLNACANAVIDCADSTCQLDCAAESCLNADMHCGEEACTANCEGSASIEVFDCEACSCESTC